MDKALQYLGLARKAGLLAVGEESSSLAAHAGKARLVLLAADASDNAVRRADAFLYGRRAARMTAPWTKEELSARLGRPGCSMVCFTDPALAAQFASAMAETLPQWQDTAALLSQRADKTRRRKEAPRKHEKRKNRRT